MSEYTILDDATFPMDDVRKLVAFFPTDFQKDILRRCDDIHLWFHEDRHFDVAEAFTELFEILDAKEKELQSVGSSLTPVTGAEAASIAAASLGSSCGVTLTQSSNDSTPTAGTTPDQQTIGSADDSSSSPLSSIPNAATDLAVSVLKDRIKDSEAYRMSTKKAAACQALADDVTDHSTWSATKIDEKGYGTYYRAEPGRTAHSFKVIGEVQESILHMASVIMELDLYTQWFPFCCEAQMQGEVTRFHKSSRFAIQMPWPMSNREVFLVGYGVDDLHKRKRIIIWSKSVAEEEELPPQIVRPAVKKGNTRISVDFGGFVIDALSPTTCRVSFIMNVDPQIPAVPITLVNWVSRKMIWVLLWQMGSATKEASKPQGKYAERRRSRPDVYLHFRERARVVFAQHFPGETLPDISV